MNVIFGIAVVVTLVLARSCNAQTVKTWKFNTNFNNTANWDRREVPCKTSVVIFPTDMQVPVLLPTTNLGKSVLEFKKLVLSRQGWLIFPRTDGILSLSSEERHASCSGGDFKFVRTGSKKWVDFDNWSTSSELSSKATPHLERIPCKFDAVTFPDESTFSITLPSRPISVSKVNIQGQDIKTQSEWNNFLYDFGYEIFPGLLERGLDSFQVSGETCGDSLGCECGNSQLVEEVCSDLSQQQTPQCADPVQPIGFCHPICGAYLLFKDGAVPAIRSETEDFFKSDEIISHTSKVNGYVQVVLVDKNEYTGDTKDYAGQLHERLLNKGLVKNSPSTMISFSGLRINSIETSNILKRFLLGLLLSFFGFGVIFCTYEKNWLTRKLDWDRISSLRSGPSNETWGFARFENTSGTVEIGAEDIPVDPPVTQQSNDTKFGFDNPMFSENRESTDGVVMSEFESRRGSFNTIDTDTGSLASSDCVSHDKLSMKEVNLQAFNQ